MLYIHGIGHFHPENCIDNSFLEALAIETSNDWILERVGIKERRTVLPLEYIKTTLNKNPADAFKAALYTNAQTGAAAAKMALDDAGILASQVGLLIAGGCMPQQSMPADACTIAAELGIECTAFDLNSACSTFAMQMHFLNQLDPNSLPDYILLVIPENLTRSVNYSDRSVAVLWGDASAALVLSKKVQSNWQIKQSLVESAPSGWAKVQLPTKGHFFQEGSAVQKFAIQKSLATLEALQQQSKINETAYFIGHQANLSMLESICTRAGIAADKHLYNVDLFGNCGAAGAVSVLSQNRKKFKSNDSILIAVVGSGLSWGGMHIEIY